jgi:penicillin-binding protein 1A
MAGKKLGTWRWKRIFLTLLVASGGGVAAAVGGGWMWVQHTYGAGVPDVSWAENYRPPIVSNLGSGDDQWLAEFYRERRHVVPYARIPKKLVQAFIAAEDADFFDHPGFDWKGIIRAAVQNVVSGRKKSGASTLTQQTAKAILITQWGFERATAKTMERKLSELILARRLEQRFSKEEILALYLNQVYLGHNSYGVQAAAENYFRKNVWDLTLGEMSLLAGLPQSPSRFSPFTHADRAKKRRSYVLEQMLGNGMISRAEHDAARAEEVTVFPVEDVFHETAPYVSEHVRRDVVARYGNDRLLSDGLQIATTVDLDLEREAARALLKGLGQADRRQGWRGPLSHLEPKSGQSLGERIREVRELQRVKGAAPSHVEELDPDASYVAAVVEVTREGAVVGVGDRIEGRLPVEQMRWARPFDPAIGFSAAPPVTDATRVVSRGDLVLVRLVEGEGREPLFALDQEPELQGALVSLDPKTGYVAAMMGGYDFDKSEFNRAFQACRQPGSSFKPVYFSAALDGRVRVDGDPRCREAGLSDEAKQQCRVDTCRERSGAWLGGVWEEEKKRCTLTPATVLLSTNIVTYDETNGKTWKPGNFDETEYGDFALHEALAKSMNLPAIKVLEGIGAHEAAQWAKQLGITSPVNEDLSIALGSSCVTLWDLTHVYAVFQRNGRRLPSTFIRRVEDRDGRVLEDHTSYLDAWASTHTRLAAGYAALFREEEQLLDPATAYVTTNLLREVCRSGTAAAASKLGRAVAGKTGTTNDSFDAWFMGYSPELVTGTWVGYDTYDHPMNGYETGGHTALPIWMEFMGAALNGRPKSDFVQPGGVTWAGIDPKTGQPGGAYSAAFRSGTEPSAQPAPSAAAAAAEELLRGTDL